MNTKLHRPLRDRLSRMAAYFALGTAASSLSLSAWAADPLRVFIRGGEANRGEEVHPHPRFMREWVKLLNERGAKAEGALDWPTAEQLAQTDVLVAYAQEGGDATPEQQARINEFVKRGGGLVFIHTATVSMQDPAWLKELIGGAWVPNKTKWREGPMDLYYVESQMLGGGHPITYGASNFHLDDEIYYDMDLSPEIRVLATSYTPNVIEGRRPAANNAPHIYDIQPQMWVYEKTAPGGSVPYRAFVSIPGHQFKTFELPHYRAILLRGIAWAGRRDNLNELCRPEELEALTYPEGGPQRPADTLANLEVHPEFDIKLIAAEPLINKPMNFDWDAEGRLWVAETPEYPNGRRGMRPDYRGKEWKDRGGLAFEPGQQDRPARDRISILSDTDGDGVMDKKEVFYEGLELVTGFVFYKDGVIVTQAPDILFLRDTNGDGKADKVEKLYTGLGTFDTHAVINNPRWGWDGWIYATHGYSASNDVKSGDGSKHFGRIDSGVVRFKPDGSAIEQYSSKGGNTWGLQITNDNRVMWTQPTSGDLLMETVLPEYALARGSVGKTPSFVVVEKSPKSYPLMSWEQLAYVQIDWVGSFTAAAGTVIYDGGAWPSEYNGDYFTTEPTINVVHHTRLTPRGVSSTYHKLPGREETEFIRSRDMWWRPIEVRVAPDGSVYLADFYNQAVIHNDTRGPDHNRVNAAVRPDRDHYFGRIWKIDHKQSKKLDVPKLNKGDAAALAQALEHPNRHVRQVAHRLLVERGQGGEEVAARLKSSQPDVIIAAMWTLANVGQLSKEELAKLLAHEAVQVRRNAALVAEAFPAIAGGELAAVEKNLTDDNAAVRLAALRALAAGDVSDRAAQALIAAWAKFDDDFQRSAAIGAAAKNPAASIAAVLDAADPSSLTPLINNLVSRLAEANDSAAAARLVIALAEKPASADSLKARILDTLSRSLQQTPEMTAELKAALSKLLTSGASSSALPVVVKWDAGRGEFNDVIKDIQQKFLATLANAQAPTADRLAAVRSLLGIRSTSDAIMPAVEKQLVADNSPEFTQGLIDALGDIDDAAVSRFLLDAYGKLSAAGQAVAFDVLYKRAESAKALLEAVKSKKVDPTTFGPANVYRLRTHPSREVADLANAMKDELNPNEKAKNEIIAQLTPIVSQPGNLENGKTMYTVSCATCHRMNGEGAEVGPDLTGMGAHGPQELLVHIIDPNREVDPSFHAWNIETTDGQFYSGVIARQNNASVLLRNIGQEIEIPTSKIKTKIDTGRSLMPEGFEALGGENLRDILAYMAGEAAGKYRVVDIASAFTADGRKGIFASEESTRESVRVKKFGNIDLDGVPFFLADPARNVAGHNLIVLRGGYRGNFARRLPQQVEVPVGVAAQRLHLLSGVAGWAWPYGGNESKGRTAMKVTLHYAGGSTETFDLKNGDSFVDYITSENVPNSKFAPGLAEGSQLRIVTLVPKNTSTTIERITFASSGSEISPVVAALTVELPGAEKKGGGPEIRSDEAGSNNQAAASGALPAVWQEAGAKKKVLLISGGSSHDFARWYDRYDRDVLSRAGFAPHYTENVDEAARLIGQADAVIYSTNQGQFSGLGFQSALRRAADGGTGLVILHPGIWYNFGENTEYNKIFVGGGSRGHDPLGEFTIKMTEVKHPVTEGLGSEIKIIDELYYAKFDPQGAKTTVLATATSPRSGDTYPSIWTVEHPKTKIVCMVPGHDGRAHELPAFQKLLINAVTWVAKP